MTLPPENSATETRVGASQGIFLKMYPLLEKAIFSKLYICFKRFQAVEFQVHTWYIKIEEFFKQKEEKLYKLIYFELMRPISDVLTQSAQRQIEGQI